MEEQIGSNTYSDAYRGLAGGVAWLFDRRWFRVAFATLTLALVAFMVAGALSKHTPPVIEPAYAASMVINTDFNGHVVKSAECPAGHFGIKGETFICDVIFTNGSTGHVSVEILDQGFWAIDLER